MFFHWEHCTQITKWPMGNRFLLFLLQGCFSLYGSPLLLMLMLRRRKWYLLIRIIILSVKLWTDLTATLRVLFSIFHWRCVCVVCVCARKSFAKNSAISFLNLFIFVISFKKTCVFLFQDIVNNSTINLDWEFKLSLMTDLVRVRLTAFHFSFNSFCEIIPVIFSNRQRPYILYVFVSWSFTLRQRIVSFFCLE